MDAKLQLNIPQPCSKDWNKMTPQQQGNFCKSCNKLVYDFTGMSDEALEQFFSAHRQEKICGRFKTEQLIAPEELQIPVHLLPSGISPFRSFALSLFLVFGTGLFFCTTVHGASVSEVRVDPKQEVKTANLSSESPRTAYLMGGTTITAPREYSIMGNMVSITARWQPYEEDLREFDFSRLNPDSLFGKKENKDRVLLPVGNEISGTGSAVKPGEWKVPGSDSVIPTTQVSRWQPPLTNDMPVTVHVSADVKPYIYVWATNADTSQHENLSVTTGYVVTVNDHMELNADTAGNDEVDTLSTPIIQFNDLPSYDTLAFPDTLWTWDFGDADTLPSPDNLVTGYAVNLEVTDADTNSMVLVNPLPQETDSSAIIRDSSFIEDESVKDKMPLAGPGLFELECFPNPTSGPLNIRYTLRTTSDISIELYDVNGRMVKRITDNPGMSSGVYMSSEDLSQLENGIYFCKMQCGQEQLTQKIILAR